MRIRHGLFLIFLIYLLYPSSFGLAFNQYLSEPQAVTWSQVTPGIDLQVFTLNNPRPVKVYVARMDRNNLSTTIESSIAQGSLADRKSVV